MLNMTSRFALFKILLTWLIYLMEQWFLCAAIVWDILHL